MMIRKEGRLTFAAHLEHPTIRGWANTLMDERKELWTSRGRAQEEVDGLKGMTVGSETDRKAAQATGK